MGGVFGDKTFGIEASSLQGLDALVDAVRILLVATTNEDVLHARGIFDLLRHIGASREQSPVAEDLRTTQGDELRLHATHRETCHGTVPLVGLGEELLVDHGDELVDEQLLELLSGEAADGAELEVVGQKQEG